MAKKREQRSRIITPKELDIMEHLIERVNSYCHVDVRLRCRENDYVMARKAFMWVASKMYGVRVKWIGSMVNTCHASTIYHVRTAQEWVDRNDKEFISLINNAFGYDIKPGVDLSTFKGERTYKKQLEELKRDVRHLEPYLELLNKVPEGREQDVADRLELFIKTMTMETSFDKTKVFEGHSAFMTE